MCVGWGVGGGHPPQDLSLHMHRHIHYWLKMSINIQNIKNLNRFKWVYIQNNRFNQKTVLEGGLKTFFFVCLQRCPEHV